MIRLGFRVQGGTGDLGSACSIDLGHVYHCWVLGPLGWVTKAFKHAVIGRC